MKVEIVPSNARISARDCPWRSLLVIKRLGKPELAIMMMPARKKIISAYIPM
jgi:hypothetical protein